MMLTLWDNGMVNSFAGTSIGLDGMAMVLNVAKQLAKRSLGTDP